MLVQAPELEAKALFAWLCEQKENKYQEGQLRTFQGRVSEWKALNCQQVAVLEQIHRPGEVLQTDGTWLNELGVSIQGQRCKHLFIHCVLPYSNWEWGCLAQSESLMALRLGLQKTLLKLGSVPKYHKTDNSTAATHLLGASEQASSGKRRGYNHGYLQLLAHYSIKPLTTNISSPQENGDVEASNGALKRALEQHLLLRGSRDFDGLEEYEAFIEHILDRRNQTRQERLQAELGVMKPLTVTPLTAHTQVRVRVSKGSLIRVLQKHYSVPTGLIGRMVTVYVYEWSLEVCLGGKVVTTLPRLTGQRKCHLNYRYVIDSLLRKPGGFRNYRYREGLFPQLIFRQAWEQLNSYLPPRKADLTYLRVLRLAARTMESEVAQALEHLLASGQRWDETDLEQLLQLQATPVPQMQPNQVSLKLYDQLLQESSYASP